MIQYWSTWNFAWFLGSRLKYFKINNALKTSVLLTSILGGSLMYIYPRKMIIFSESKNKYTLSNSQRIIGDFLFHQIPMFITLSSPNEEELCGRYVLIPFTVWLNYNYIRKQKMFNLYHVNMSYLLTIGFSLFLSGSYIKHKLLK
tara:strand:+ start:3324 stop:3758 length:435 start_codon:yes stop_codon:yes gene_type:complete